MANADVHQKDVKKALNVAVREYNKQDQGSFLSKVSKVITAQKQVVSGMKYIFRVRMVYTVCRKDENQSVKRGCAINPDPQLAKPIICNFEVWSQPWLNKPPQVKISCGH
ncbi:cystatin-like [Scleropages formosus]|uniref:Cystatin-like n=1 Tax=Scleropages formosus TaxID=113540 RepID=A0A0P7UKD2_SCLFO|nr:cystatin-like [Scleropages formosus]